MITIEHKKEMREMSFRLRKEGKTIGFVPTMGYLHSGHLDLVKEARKQTDVVVVSIYVNPAQFGKNEDLSRYPRDIPRDLALLEELNTDIVFLPPEGTMYASDHLTWVEVERMSDLLCGKSRQGHFRGVATVVLKLLNIVQPDLMFMGEKDFQQTVILEKMIADLDLAARIVRCPTVREEDGLAMSSRNRYLSPDGRKNAASLYQALLLARDLYRQGTESVKEVTAWMRMLIDEKGGKIDYIDIVDSKNLKSVETIEKGCRIVLAVFFDGARLIDNIEIN